MTTDERHFRARVIFAWLFLVLVYFFWNNSLLSQFGQPTLKFPESDLSFWAYHASGLHAWLMTNSWAALGFDLLLTTSCLIVVIVPQQRLFTWITVVGVWILYLAYCSVAGKHYAQIGYLIMPVAFLAVKPERFALTWDLIRYWICFLYVSAGVYKIYYGGFAASDNLSPILMQMNADWFYFHPNGSQAAGIRYLIDHPRVAQAFYRLTVLVDLLPVLGFFTRKFDRWILIGLVGFHVANLLLNHISFVEQSLIFAPFLPWERWGEKILQPADYD